MKPKNFFNKAYFYFSIADRITIAGALLFCFICIILLKYIPLYFFKSAPDVNQIKAYIAWQQEIAALHETQTFEKNDNSNNFTEKNSFNKEENNTLANLQAFDPNTATVEELQLLGLPQKVIQNIEKYRNKGGYFKDEIAFSKVYGLTPQVFAQIKNYLIFNKSNRYNTPQSTKNNGFETKYTSAPTQYKKYEKAVIDINTADTTAFKSLKGIGSKLANRIVAYRTRLGGFINKNQLLEVYGIKDSVLIINEKYLQLNTTSINLLNINTATLKDLQQHPYIGFKYAKIILNYKEQHGDYKNIDDMLKIKLIDASAIQKMQPYLQF